MAALFLGAILLLALLAPLLGKDSSDARSEDSHDSRGWWPAGPDTRPLPRY